MLSTSLGGAQWELYNWGIIRKAWPWAIAGNVFVECHAPCPLKTSFVDFEHGRHNVSIFSQFNICYWQCLMLVKISLLVKIVLSERVIFIILFNIVANELT